MTKVPASSVPFPELLEFMCTDMFPGSCVVAFIVQNSVFVVSDAMVPRNCVLFSIVQAAGAVSVTLLFSAWSATAFTVAFITKYWCWNTSFGVIICVTLTLPIHPVLSSVMLSCGDSLSL